MKNLFRKIVNKLLLPHSQLGYAQSGEDLILSHLFYKISISRPTYLDIGANHPFFISNTYYFYMRGSRGVCVEPNPYLSKLIRRKRPHDKVIQAGVGINKESSADFYLFPKHAHGLSTFSKKDAEYWGRVGMKKTGPIRYEKIIQVPLININSIIEDNFKTPPDIISLDVEGLDLGILESLDHIKNHPKVICVETLLYDERQQEAKNGKLIDFLVSKDYSIYADTHVNTIFIHNSITP